MRLDEKRLNAPLLPWDHEPTAWTFDQSVKGGLPDRCPEGAGCGNLTRLGFRFFRRETVRVIDVASLVVLYKSCGGPEGRGGELHISHRAPTKTLTEP
jgi:hypothetical protein